MINGFAKEALVVYPLLDDYEDRNMNYHNKLSASAEKLTQFLHKSDVKVDCFATDDVARLLSVRPDRWALTLNKCDMFFVSRNCVGMSDLGDNTLDYPDVWEETAEKYPIVGKPSLEGRFELILKRDSNARLLISKKYKIVIIFVRKKSPALRFTTKQNSGVMYFEIDFDTLQAKCFMSAMPMNVIDVTGILNANMPVYEWEVK